MVSLSNCGIVHREDAWIPPLSTPYPPSLYFFTHASLHSKGNTSLLVSSTFPPFLLFIQSFLRLKVKIIPSLDSSPILFYLLFLSTHSSLCQSLLPTVGEIFRRLGPAAINKRVHMQDYNPRGGHDSTSLSRHVVKEPRHYLPSLDLVGLSARPGMPHSLGRGVARCREVRV